jgi:hypothetical protein
LLELLLLLIITLELLLELLELVPPVSVTHTSTQLAHP